MTVSFVAAASAEADTLTLPSHQAGDLLVMFVYRSASTVSPTVPSGWFRATFRSTGSQCSIVAFKVAQLASETSGTWINADMLACAVYRDSVNFVLVGGIAHVSVTASTTVQYQTIAAPGTGVTNNSAMRSNSGYVIGCVGITANNSNVGTAPTGMTNRTEVIGSGARHIALHDTNAEVSAWTSTIFTQSQSTNGHVHTVEIFDSGCPKASGHYDPLGERFVL